MIRFTPAYALFRCSFRCVRHVTLPYRPHITPLLASLEDGRGARAPGSKTPGSAGNRALGPYGASDRNRRAASPPSVRCGPCGPLRAAPANGSAVSSAPRPQPGSIPAAGSKTPGSAGEPGARTLWSQRQESNPQPTDYKSVALPLSHAGASGAHARKASTGY